MSNTPNIFVISATAPRLPDLVSGATRMSQNVTVICAKDGSAAFSYGAQALLTLPGTPQRIFEDFAPSIAAHIKPTEQALVLLPNDRRGKAMAAKLGHLLKAAVINDVTALPESGDIQRLVYGGLAVGSEKSLSSITVLTVSTGVFEAKEKPTTGPSSELAFVEPAVAIRLVEVKPKAGSSVDIGKARRLVAVGRGFVAQDDLGLAKSFAEAVEAELACSRPIAEGEHWMERERYIGVSGVMVKSDVYVAVGISGQIQHMVGARDCKTIIAINKDKNAPIFKCADYGIVGDLYKILPALTKAFK